MTYKLENQKLRHIIENLTFRMAECINRNNCPGEIAEILKLGVINARELVSLAPTYKDSSEAINTTNKDNKYAVDQHKLICRYLSLSDSPDVPGDTALEAVVKIKMDLEDLQSDCKPKEPESQVVEDLVAALRSALFFVPSGSIAWERGNKAIGDATNTRTHAQ